MGKLIRTNKNLRFFFYDQSGAVIIIVAISMIVLLGFTALAIDVGYLMLTRNQLQNTADAAALAGARTLGRLYECDGNLGTCPGAMSYEDQLTYDLDDNPDDKDAILDAIAEVASQNKAGEKAGITINDDDVVIGNWHGTSKTLDATMVNPDAVRVTARRDASANGPVTTFFANVLGINTAEVSATATAALTGIAEVTEGGLPIPIGISRYRFESDFCQQDIKFHPTGGLEGCAGWHVYDTSPSSDSKLRKILEGLLDGTYESPETKAFETYFSFTGGTLSTKTFEAMDNLFNYMKTRDGDGEDDKWTTQVVVYDRDDCSNPNQSIQIVGFATAKIREVIGPSEKELTAEIQCGLINPGHGGGGDYGTKGTIPNIVQ